VNDDELTSWLQESRRSQGLDPDRITDRGALDRLALRYGATHDDGGPRQAAIDTDMVPVVATTKVTNGER
jgi:hypothetical protein